MAVHPVDEYVGKRIEAKRTELGMAHEVLADALDVTVKQVRDYERGVTRVGSENLPTLCELFGVDNKYFFEGFYSSDLFSSEPTLSSSITLLIVKQLRRIAQHMEDEVTQP